MKKKKKFAIHLSKERIELLVKGDSEEYQTIGYTDPNKPNLNQSLNIILNQLKALIDGKPVVDVMLPHELILTKNITIRKPLGEIEALEILSQSCNLKKEELRLAVGSPTSDLTQPVAAVTTATINEARIFLRQAGFFPKDYTPAKPIAGFKEPPIFERDWTQKTDLATKRVLKTAAPICTFFVICAFTLNYFFSLQEESNTKNILSPIFSEKPISLNEFEFSTDSSINERLAKPEVSPIISPGLKLQTENNYKDFNDNLYKKGRARLGEASKLESIAIEGNVYRKDPTENLILKFSSDQNPVFNMVGKEFSEANMSKLAPFEYLKNNNPVITPENEKKVPFSYQNKIIEKSFFNENKILGGTNFGNSLDIKREKFFLEDTNKSVLSYKPASYNKDIRKPIINENLFIKDSFKFRKQDNSIFLETGYFAFVKTILIDKKFLSLNSNNFSNRNDSVGSVKNSEIYRESTSIPDKTYDPLKSEELKPLARPLEIATIKILSEPTLSSGAVTFSNDPLPRPQLVSNTEPIDAEKISFGTKTTRAPTFPKRASVISNATINNILELNRTNLIGIFGTEFNAAALVRLSSGKIIKVKVGDRFDGWRVFAIDKDKIHLANGSKQETLRLPG